LTVTFSSAGSCSNSGATYTITSGTGTCSVIANQAGNSNYCNDAGHRNCNRHASESDHHVHHTAPASAAYGSNFTVAATASSGLTVSYTSSGSCSNSGATYTMTAAPELARDRQFRRAMVTMQLQPPVTETVTASLTSQTITFTTPAPATHLWQ